MDTGSKLLVDILVILADHDRGELSDRECIEQVKERLDTPVIRTLAPAGRKMSTRRKPN